MTYKTIRRLDRLADILEGALHGVLGVGELLLSDFIDGKRAQRKRCITRAARSTRRTARTPYASYAPRRRYYFPVAYRQPRPVVIIVTGTAGEPKVLREAA